MTSIEYELTDDNALEISFVAMTTKPTLVNMGSHCFFNLGESISAKIFFPPIKIIKYKKYVLLRPTKNSIILYSYKTKPFIFDSVNNTSFLRYRRSSKGSKKRTVEA